MPSSRKRVKSEKGPEEDRRISVKETGKQQPEG